MEKLFRQTGRTTRRLQGALCFARGLPPDHVVVRDHTCAP